MTTLRALLLTDVVDSTQLTETLGDTAMAALWASHDRTARELLPRWRGREIDKTDGMLLLFDGADDALGYALAYHRALAALGLPFKARAGIHVGSVSLRANPADDVARGAKPVEVDGLALPIAARVMSVALGGQTLLSADARGALGAAPARLQSHGHWRLHGVAEPVELFEAGDDDAPFTVPPDAAKAYRVVRQGELWQPVRQIPRSLPAERDSFVGRSEPLQALARKLEAGARLVSVLGIGGTGKTRLVTRFAWTWLGEFPGGVWFCDLSQARSADGISFAVAHGLDVPLGKTEPVVQLAHAIAGRGKCLMILDNFEQVARYAEETLGHWLDRAPQASFVVTTREVLGIVGEETLALAPLPAGDAAALFQRRAESASHDYRPGAEDRAAAAELVKVLDGLPLAIELAAARVRVMSPRMLLARMNERFKLLWSSAGRHDRQATLRAAFDWSWELLTEPEKAALAQLSVFEGGFALASAEAVLDLSATEHPPWAVDAVQWLVDKSFVRRVAADRFDLLESVREYAAEHLRSEGHYPGSGAAAALAAQRRHWRHFASIDERAAVADGCVETTNLMAACRRAATAGEAAAAVGALTGAWAALRLRGPFRSAAGLADRVLGIADLQPAQQAWADWVGASALDLCGEVGSARTRLDRGLRAARAAGDTRCEARLLILLASQRAAQGLPDDALADLTTALTLARRLADRALECGALNALGKLFEYRSHLVDARRHYEAALDLAKQLDDRRMQGGLLGNLGGLHHAAGRLDEAARHYDFALALAQQVGDRQWEGNARCNQGLVHHEQGDWKRAQQRFEQALGIARDAGHVRLECTVLCNLGIALEAQGRPGEALERYEKAVAIAHELADRRLEGQFRGYLGLLHARGGRFAEARACLDVGEALLVEVDDELSLGLLSCSRAEAECLAGDSVAAQASHGRARRLAEKAQVGADSELGRAIAQLQALFAATPVE